MARMPFRLLRKIADDAAEWCQRHKVRVQGDPIDIVIALANLDRLAWPPSDDRLAEIRRRATNAEVDDGLSLIAAHQQTVKDRIDLLAEVDRLRALTETERAREWLWARIAAWLGENGIVEPRDGIDAGAARAEFLALVKRAAGRKDG